MQCAPIFENGAQVVVSDATTNVDICDAMVTLNGAQSHVVTGGGDDCYYASDLALEAGNGYTVVVSHAGYVTNTVTGQIDPDTEISVQLIPQ
ncbi:MAG TPA: hypothetical protein VGH28_31635 [Polyangiaceae bacterium]|jgi:hypothetical protein